MQLVVVPDLHSLVAPEATPLHLGEPSSRVRLRSGHQRSLRAVHHHLPQRPLPWYDLTAPLTRHGVRAGLGGGGRVGPRRGGGGHVLLHLASAGRHPGPLHDGSAGNPADGEEAGGLGASHGRGALQPHPAGGSALPAVRLPLHELPADSRVQHADYHPSVGHLPQRNERIRRVPCVCVCRVHQNVPR